MIDNGDAIVSQGSRGELAEMEFAAYCAYFLTKVYPGHPWPVECHETSDGMDIRIRHVALQNFPDYAYYINPKDNHSPTALHQLLIMGGGEILDRLGFARNKPWNGDVALTVPGVNKTLTVHR